MDVQRRRLIGGMGSGLALVLAGCADSDEEEEGDDHDHDDHDDHDHDEDDHEHDEDDGGEGEGSDGLLYAFATETTALVDPESGKVVEELDVGSADWGDPRVTRDGSRIFVNNGETAQAIVIDTESREVADEVDVGPDPVHNYNPVEGEIWSHSDAEGSFYVVDTEELEVVDVVEAGLEREGHGKLLTHPDLDPKAYAMNVTDAAGLVIDLEARERSADFPLEGEGGTHYKAYAPETGLAYFQRTGEPGGTAVIDTETDEVVGNLDLSGGMYLSPDETLLGVLDEEEVVFLDATSEDSEVVGTIPVEGEPGALRYYEGDEGLYGFTANTTTSDVSVLDLESFEEVDRIETGDSEGEYRAGVANENYFATTADADGTVTIVDMNTGESLHDVEVGDGVDTLQFVGESGVGYTSQ